MITDINQLPTESESAFVCADCMDVMFNLFGEI